MKDNLLVLLDGISGSGKGSHAEYVAELLTKHSYNPAIVREPTDFLGKFIREYRQRPDSERDAEVETLLFTADRKQHVKLTVSNILSRPGTAVVSDRSWISTAVYQSLQGMSLDRIIDLNSFYPTPDLSLILLCDPDEALKRIEDRAKKTGTKVSPDERTKIASLKAGYETIAAKLPQINAKFVNTDGSLSAVKYQILSHINNILGIPMEKAVFLDKDGTLVDNSQYPEKIPSDDIYVDNTVEGLRRLNDAGYRLIIISSQPWVKRGRMTAEEIEATFRSVVKQYADLGVKIDDYFYCMHSRDEGCICKKPNTGLYEQAAQKYNIDTSRSYMVGDMDIDILAGRNFGLKSCLILTGNGKEHQHKVKPDYVEADINFFTKRILY